MNGFKKMFSCCIAHRRYLLLAIIFFTSSHFSNQSYAQVKDSVIVKADSTIVITEVKKDSAGVLIKDSVVKKRVYVPRSAAIRSAILPGLGQLYNRKYWKVPVVYAALGITGYVFFDNLKTYKDLRFAYAAKYTASIGGDSTDYKSLSPLFQQANINSIKSNRDEFRRNIDYSVLVFILFWGLNVVDATVDAHLKGFDVSPDLTLKFKAGHSAMAGTNGISLVLSFRDRHGK
jgi:hypothetical protein